MTIIDAFGTRHEPAGDDARIVSLVPSITELLIDMGLAAQTVGRTHYCVHPAAAVAEIPSVGGTKKINPARLRELAPTHVIVNVDENPKAMADEIAAFVPSVVVTHPLVPADNLDLYRLIGGLFGRAERAAKLCADYEAAAARLAERAHALPPRDVVYWIWKEPWMSVSRDTYASALLDLVNWRTLCHDPAIRYPEVAITDALLRGADLMLFSSEPYAFTAADMDAFRAAHPDTVGSLALIDGTYTQWYGSRAIRGLDYLGEMATELA